MDDASELTMPCSVRSGLVVVRLRRVGGAFPDVTEYF